MKRKDMVYLILAVAILLVAGYMAYNILFGSKQKTAKVPEAEVVGLISPDFDNATMTTITNSDKTVDYSIDIDTKSGVGNAAVFGQ